MLWVLQFILLFAATTLSSSSLQQSALLQRLNNCEANYTYTGSKGEKLVKYFCIKCERDTTGPNKAVRVCKRCKYGLTRNGTCDSYLSNAEYDSKHQNVGGVEMCEGAYYDNNTNTSRCFMCTEGYALQRTDQDYQCVKSKLSKCIVSDLINRQERCFVCRNAVPNSAFSKCEEKLIEGLDPNCEFGMRHPVHNDGNPFCALCNRNFALIPVMQNNSQERLVCRPTLPATTGNKLGCARGCARCNAEGTCLWCSHYHGFYMIDEGTCMLGAELRCTNILLTLIFLLSVTL